jgi:hypothetical protein
MLPKAGETTFHFRQTAPKGRGCILCTLERLLALTSITQQKTLSITAGTDKERRLFSASLINHRNSTLIYYLL